MLSGLHIEMTAWTTLGKWLDSSGGTAALVQADIATPGKVDFFLKALHVSGTRHAHQLTAAAPYTLLQKAYSSYVEEHNYHADNFDDWSQLKEDGNPQFKFWSLTLEFQLSFLVCRQIIKRRGLQKIAPLMFALDHPNYARWLPLVVVVNHCFTSLFGTNGLLSDIVIR